MIFYPMFPNRETIVPEGLWQFKFVGEALLESLNLKDFVFDDVMAVPGSFDCSPSYYSKRGVALYQNEFIVKKEMEASLLKIDGIGLRGKFWIDGKEVGFTNLPYSGVVFSSGRLAAGRHTISAAIDNRFDADKMKLFLPNYDFYAFGGFYRGLSVSGVPETCIERVQVLTRDFRSGRVRVRVLFNGKPLSETTLKFRFDTEKEFKTVPVKIHEAAAEMEFSVPDFQLWSPDNPHMHTLETVMENGDSAIESFGIREIRTEGNRILLNGEAIRLKGFNRHESHPEFGAAVPLPVMIEDLQNLKRLHCNFIRGAHYPQDPKFLQLCDSAGFLVWEESLGWGNSAAQMSDPEFIRLQIEQTRLMVRNSINHPSVVIWAFLNEFHSVSEEGRNLCRDLVKMIREEDPTRLVSFADAHCHADAEKPNCYEFLDVVSYNTYPGWISADYADEPESYFKPDRDRILDLIRQRGMDRKPVIVSEMGCCAIYGEHSMDSAQWTEEFQARYLEEVITRVFEMPEISGLAIWQFNDAKSYLRKGDNIRTKPLACNLAGVFDRYRRPKLAAATVERLFKDIPAIR